MEVKQQQNSISLQMSSPKHMDIKVNSNVKSFCESPTKSLFASTYQILSSSPNALNKINKSSYSVSPVKKNSPLVKLMDSEAMQNTHWNNYSNTNNKNEMNFMNNLSNNNSNIKDVLNNISNINKNNNTNSNNLNDNSFIEIKSIKNNISSSVNNHAQEDSNDIFTKKSIRKHFENKTNDKNLSQLSYQISKASLEQNGSKEELNNNNKLTKSLNYNKSVDTEAIAEIVFKKQEANEVEKLHAESNEKIELQKSLYSCQLSLSPKDKILENNFKNASMNININNKKSPLTKEDFESTKVIKENARKMLFGNGTCKPTIIRKPRSVKFSGENEECPFRRYEAPVSVITSPIFLVNSTIKPFLETRCNLTTFSEFKQRMIIKKPILIEKAGLLIEENEKSSGNITNFIKNADIKKEHGVFKSRPSHVPYGPSSTACQLFSTSEKDKIRVVIQVQNLAYQKEVYVRYTFNNWLTSKDVSATYMNSLNVTSYISKKFHESTSINSNASCQERNTTGIDDSESKIVSKSVDRFVADIEIPSYIMDFMDYDNNFFNHNSHLNASSSEYEDSLFLKDRRRYSQSLGEEWDNDIINKCTLKFAAFYRVNNQEYWENNNNLNYTIDISRVLYIPTKKVYIRSRTPEIIKSRMVNFADAFYNETKPKKGELKSILKGNCKENNDNKSIIESKILAKCELREKCIRETIQKELSGTTFFKQMGINPTILNTIINSNRVSTRNNIIKMIMYYQRKAGITNPIIPIEKETSINVEGN